MSKLLIVESLAKAKTIQKYLGPGFEVVASYGHIRDLPKKEFALDVENNFEPKYVEMPDKKEIIKTLKSKAADSDFVYLAADPDREGEAIAWHLCHILALGDCSKNRITFNEITKSGVEKGINSPRDIDMDLVNSQQARRVLDRIVGYKLSPFLWKKIKRGLSAGRVQSVAVKIICDREEEIRAFISEEYWSIDAKFLKDKIGFDAKLHGLLDGKKLEITNEEEATKIVNALNGAIYKVQNVKKGQRKKQSPAPFITSTLQQDASRRLGYNAQRTMSIAQGLYEGVDIAGIGTTGLITYMRTDSLRTSDEARTAGTDFIKNNYGKNYLPETPRVFKSKKGAQDAHEAIRPTNVELTPDKVKGSLKPDQYKLYKLVWDRFVASLMAPCLQNTVNVDITANDYLFKASGYTVKFDGFTVLYEESKDEADDAAKALPELAKGDIVNLSLIAPNQHFTQPPPRYNEASLIKTLEENGIGRPSTYAPIITTIVSREYVERNGKQLVPTALGEVVNSLMVEQFKDIVDLKFTANVEDELDDIEEGKKHWHKVIGEFYKGFEENLEKATINMEGKRLTVPEVVTEIPCENCGRMMVIRSGRFGKFLACPGFPECKTTKPIVQEADGFCPLCASKILLRKSSKGNKYYACEKGQDCGFMTWDVPTKQECPQCGKTLFKRRGGITLCLDETCGYEESKAKKDDGETKKTTRKSATKKTTTKKTTTKKTTAKKATTTKKATTKKATAKKVDEAEISSELAVDVAETAKKTTAKKATTKKTTTKKAATKKADTKKSTTKKTTKKKSDTVDEES